ncbi:unnamed protein product [Pieris macdunnoughi]|uniref:Uncharacterized protein n=1 Tax=Pieris macdunnoughi TaxID=345717 RepID=A0A821MI20_9NEOP|nr:unnamed protein product [Pieris macdunnoughi]
MVPPSSMCNIYVAVDQFYWQYVSITAVNAAHDHPHDIRDGDEPSNEKPDWGEHQVETLLDRKDVNGSTFAVATLFEDHALHHMFPTLDHAVLKYLHPSFMDHSVKFQANYRESTQFKITVGQFKEIMQTEFKTRGDGLNIFAKEFFAVLKINKLFSMLSLF